MNVQNLKEKWQQYSELFDSRVLRERVLIFASCIAVIYVVWDFSIASPQAKVRQNLEVRFTNAQKGLTQISAEEQVMVKALSNAPGAAKRRELVRLENQLHALEEKLQALSVGLLPAEELAVVLYDVLVNSKNVKMIGLKKNPVEELMLEGAVDVNATQNSQENNMGTGNTFNDSGLPLTGGVFKHSVTVALKGRYFDVRDYLKKLETLSWTLYWNELEYEVTNYPEAMVTLDVYTLSTSKGVLGE